jgi:hypothetical protein
MLKNDYIYYGASLNSTEGRYQERAGPTGEETPEVLSHASMLTLRRSCRPRKTSRQNLHLKEQRGGLPTELIEGGANAQWHARLFRQVAHLVPVRVDVVSKILWFSKVLQKMTSHSCPRPPFTRESSPDSLLVLFQSVSCPRARFELLGRLYSSSQGRRYLQRSSAERPSYNRLHPTRGSFLR